MNVFAIRHSETAWSLSEQHTGTRDIPLDLTIMREMRQLLAHRSSAGSFSRCDRVHSTLELLTPRDPEKSSKSLKCRPAKA